MSPKLGIIAGTDVSRSWCSTLPARKAVVVAAIRLLAWF
jgi:hypothetical protein